MKWVLDAHCHTTASGHAYSTISEIFETAQAKGLSLVAITDHAPGMPGVNGDYHFMNTYVMPKTISGVRYCSGVELNIMDVSGAVDLDDYVLQQLDVVIASLHVPCFAPLSEAENTQAVINAMRNPYVNIVGHLGDPRYPIDLNAIVDAAVAYGVILEINNASLHPSGFRRGSEGNLLQMIKQCKEKNWPVILGSDAHYRDDIGNFSFAERLVKAADMPDSLILNTSIDMFEQYILNKIGG